MEIDIVKPFVFFARGFLVFVLAGGGGGGGGGTAFFLRKATVVLSPSSEIDCFRLRVCRLFVSNASVGFRTLVVRRVT
jgi:hypothetical protein